MHAPQAVENRADARPLRRRRLARRRVGAHRTHDAVEGAHGIVIDRRVIEADVIVVRRERDVLAAQRRIATRQNRDDVARRERDGRMR